MSGCLVSVLIVSCNHRAFLGEAVRSALAQGCEAAEIVIFDDGSADGSLDEARLLAETFPQRIRVFSHKNNRNEGIGATYQAAIAECRGEYIAFLEADDRWLPDNLRKKIGVLSADKSVGVVYSDVAAEVEPGAPGPGALYCRRVASVPAGRGFNAFPATFIFNPIPTFSCAVVRRELLEGLEFKRAARDEPWTDWSIWNQLAARTRFCFLPERLVVWRHHRQSAYGRLKQKMIALKAAEMRQRAIFMLRALKILSLHRVRIKL